MVQHETNQPTIEDLERLSEVSQLLTVVDLDSVLQEVIQLSARVVGASRASVFLHKGAQVDWDHLITMRDLSPDQSVKVVTRVLDEGFAGWVYRHKRGDIIEDTLTDPRWIIFPDDPVKIRSALCVPFLSDNEVVAVITLVHEQPAHFKIYHLRLMKIVANQAAVAIRNAQLFQRINDQHQKLQVVLHSMADILIVLDEFGKIEMVNQAALLLLAAPKQEAVLQQPLSDFMMADTVFDPIIEIIRAKLVEKEARSFETRSERRQTDYQVTMSVWEDTLRGRTGYVIVMHDITTLRDLARFKDEMLHLASHDLRSPLALIAGYADMIRMDTEENTQVHEYVEVIKSSVESMGILVEDLLRIERIRNSALELRQHTDIEALTKVAIVNARPAAKAKQLDFQSDLHLDGMPRIVVDPVLIRQAMENFIGNAIKYTPEGGSIMVHAHYDDNRFHFSVEDTGIGIPEEHQPYVFESFYRVEKARYKEKGSGLGLSLVKNVIERHRGEVWLKSVAGEGSRFGFWVPMEQ